MLMSIQSTIVVLTTILLALPQANAQTRPTSPAVNTIPAVKQAIPKKDLKKVKKANTRKR